jgi:hypothetical protein
MNKARSFLVVVDDPERLMRVARDWKLDAIVAQRSSDLDELPLVEKLRAVTTAPILLMSSPQQEADAAAAGASDFLRHDQWLLVGTAVARLIGAKSTAG